VSIEPVNAVLASPTGPAGPTVAAGAAATTPAAPAGLTLTIDGVRVPLRPVRENR
jgi:hypothetical protein